MLQVYEMSAVNVSNPGYSSLSRTQKMFFKVQLTYRRKKENFRLELNVNLPFRLSLSYLKCHSVTRTKHLTYLRKKAQRESKKLK